MLFLTSIMRPEREAPGLVADEVGMIIGNAEVVNLRVAARRADGADRDTRARVQAGDAVADSQFTGRGPALAPAVEGMLAGRADNLALHMKVQDAAESLIGLHDAAQTHWFRGFALRAGEEQIALGQRLDGLVAARRVAVSFNGVRIHT